MKRSDFGDEIGLSEQISSWLAGFHIEIRLRVTPNPRSDVDSSFSVFRSTRSRYAP